MVERGRMGRTLAVAIVGLLGLAACEPAVPTNLTPTTTTTRPVTTTAPPTTTPPTAAPVTTAPVTAVPTTAVPTTAAPTTAAPTTAAPVVADPSRTSGVALAFGSTWRWSYQAAAPPATWRDPGFDARSWGSGPGRFGFGDDAPKATVISDQHAPRPLASYYRTSITVDDPNRFETYAFDVVRDGGVAISVNGVEVARDNLTPGPVTHDATWAAVPVPRAEREIPVRLEVPSSAFRPGANTVAVSLHLNWRSQPNTTFDLQVTGLAGAAAPPAAPTTPAGWTHIGGDEFDGSTVDPTRWRQYHNTYGDGNNELACLTPANLSVGGGTLRIAARKQRVTCPNGSARDYTSGFIGSREVGVYFPRYARFEMRAKLPHAQGLWPAFWLRHRNGAGVAEVDIMEYFHAARPGRTDATLHLDGRANVSKGVQAFEAPTADPGWHVWAVEISPATNGVRFEFFFDGVSYHSFVDTQHAWRDRADPAATWDVAVNMAVGGNWVGRPDDTLGYLRDLNRCAQSGTAPSGCATTGIERADWGSASRTTFEIDHLRVYTRTS